MRKDMTRETPVHRIWTGGHRFQPCRRALVLTERHGQRPCPPKTHHAPSPAGPDGLCGAGLGEPLPAFPFPPQTYKPGAMPSVGEIAREIAAKIIGDDG